jgi:PAS domain S-box-containing protein
MGIHKPDGTLAWVSMDSHPILSEGQPRSAVTIFTDVTQRKATEHALQLGEDRWKLAVEGLRDGIWDWNLDTGEVFYSRRWKEMLGFQEDELAVTRSEWESRIHPEERASVLAAVRDHLDGHTPFYQAEYRVRCKDGGWKWVLARGAVVSRAADGRVLRFVGAHADITDRKLAEARLRESEERLAKVFQCSPAAIVLSDREEDGRVIEVNDAFEKITGYRRDEIVGRAAMESVLFADPLELAQAYGYFKEQGRFANFEFRLRRKDGELRTCVVSAESIQVNGRTCSLSAMVDITGLKRAEEALRRSEAKYRAIVENSRDGILFADANGVILERSPSLSLIAGYTDEERVGHLGFENIHPDDLALARKSWTEVVSNPEASYRIEYRIRHKDGTWRWVETSAQNLLSNPNVQAVVLTTRDITDRIATRQALEHARSNLTALVESTDDLIWSVDSQHRVLTCNRAFTEYLRINHGVEIHPGDVQYERLAAPVAEKWQGFYRRAFEEGPCRMESRITGGRTVEFSLSPILSGGERVGVSVFGKDITERKQVEAQREKLWAQLAQAQKMESVGRLAGGVAHDFNNLLTVINGYSQLALARLKDGDPLRGQLEEIGKAGERAARLTRQLLAFSRKQVMQPRVLDLNQVVGEMQSMLQRLVGEDVEVTFALSEERPTLQADPHQLEQVIMNLVVNAKDAMPSGGRLRIETALVDRDDRDAAVNPEIRSGRYAMLSVSDTGVGMDRETLQQIYEPFFTTKGAGQGTGLGLSMVQGIVVQSGGYINVSSEPGKGTTFRIFLPAPAGVETEQEKPVAPRALRGTETILVVEDQPELCDYATAVLREYGYRVIQAAGAADALLICEREPAPIHLLLTDVVMPNLSGPELVARLASTRPGMKTLFMSGYSGDVIAHHGVLDEGTNFIEKPFRPEELAGKVRAVLGPRDLAARILVVDDEPAVRSFLRTVLEPGGYVVSEAANGKEAMRLALAEPPELVITDLVMPEQEGIETIQLLRRRLPDIGIIAISGAFGGQFLSTAKILGADVALDKPFSAEVLLAKVTEVLMHRR